MPFLVRLIAQNRGGGFVNRILLIIVRAAKLKMNPGSTEFVYCNMITTVIQPSPYELEIVPYARVVPDNYFTVSASSVTHFQGADVGTERGHRLGAAGGLPLGF
jgi:hypothetical protein